MNKLSDFYYLKQYSYDYPSTIPYQAFLVTECPHRRGVSTRLKKGSNIAQNGQVEFSDISDKNLFCPNFQVSEFSFFQVCKNENSDTFRACELSFNKLILQIRTRNLAW